MSRHDDLSDRARWFLNNFDEVDLADLCASAEASNKAREATLARIAALAATHPGSVPTNLLDEALGAREAS